MRSGIQIARVMGIPICLHWTFLLLFGFVMLVGLEGVLPEGRLARFVFLVSLFGCVLLHELGHCFAALHYRIRVRDIVLYPIGGAARLERMPRKPLHELVITFAGPAVNAVLAALAFGALLLFGATVSVEREWTLGIQSFLNVMFAINVILLVFNALPAFPMDGGRVLRAALAFRLNYLTATWIAVRIGQVIAVALFFFGLSAGSLTLPFIGLMLIWEAQRELNQARMREMFQDVRVADAMVTDYVVAFANEPLAQAARKMGAEGATACPVLRGEEVAGVLTAAGLKRLHTEPDARVEDAMSPDVSLMDEEEPLIDAVMQIARGGTSLVVVLRDGHLAGVLTDRSMIETLQMRAYFPGGAPPR